MKITKLHTDQTILRELGVRIAGLRLARNLTQAALSGQDDSDEDGLTNSEEIQFGTDALKPDTDEDGLLDGAEVQTHLTDPLLSDTDGDLLLDGEEVETHLTDPLNIDTDADGLNDGAEIEYALGGGVLPEWDEEHEEIA